MMMTNCTLRGARTYCLRGHRVATFSTDKTDSSHLKKQEFRMVDGGPTYLHPLSQIVLERMQSAHYGWVTREGLDRGLTINEDGSFVLKFPSKPVDYGKRKDDGSKIWTNYEPTEKKHWLLCAKADIVGKFLLQDNLKPAWHSSKESTPEKVQAAVDDMIKKISEGDEKE